jgi:putative transposase
VDELARLLIETLLHYREQKKYLLHEFVMMPKHLHLLLTSLITLERAMQLIKGGYSYRVGQTGRKLEVWQLGLTDHRIRDYTDYEHHVKYLQFKPVRAGLCPSSEHFV